MQTRGTRIAAALHRGNKYHAKGVHTGEGYFHSRSEHARWCQLKLMERAGLISDLRRQISFPFVIEGRAVKIRSGAYPNGRIAKYTADFTYYRDGERVIEDWKGKDTGESRLRRAITETIYQCKIEITGAAA